MWFKRTPPPVILEPVPNLLLLPMPPLLIELIKKGRWCQPSDAKIYTAIPFLQEPVDFVRFGRWINWWSGTWESEAHLHLVDHPLFQEYQGSTSIERPLPWLDAEKALFIAVNRDPGADLGIALDYRTNSKDPRVVASDWWSEENSKCNWRLVDERFSNFVQKLGL